MPQNLCFRDFISDEIVDLDSKISYYANGLSEDTIVFKIDDKLIKSQKVEKNIS